MPHFDEDDRDEVFEKDSKESKDFKENGEEMDVDVDDELTAIRHSLRSLECTSGLPP